MSVNPCDDVRAELKSVSVREPVWWKKRSRGAEEKNAQQIMRANVAHENPEEVSFEHAFSVVISLDITGAGLKTTSPSERVEIYDSGTNCHMSPYIEVSPTLHSST
jgi:hypothetical protein